MDICTYAFGLHVPVALRTPFTTHQNDKLTTSEPGQPRNILTLSGRTLQQKLFSTSSEDANQTYLRCNTRLLSLYHYKAYPE